MAHKYRKALVDSLENGGGIDLMDFFREEVNFAKYCERHSAEHQEAPEVKKNDFKAIIRQVTVSEAGEGPSPIIS